MNTATIETVRIDICHYNTTNLGITSRGGIVSQVTFTGLTEKEHSYAILCARINFHQLVITANMMLEQGINFTQATKQYLLNHKKYSL